MNIPSINHSFEINNSSPNIVCALCHVFRHPSCRRKWANSATNKKCQSTGAGVLRLISFCNCRDTAWKNISFWALQAELDCSLIASVEFVVVVNCNQLKWERVVVNGRNGSEGNVLILNVV